MFYADVLRRTCQYILVTRYVHSSYSIATIVPNETSDSLRNGLLISTCNIRATSSTVHVDNAPGFTPLKDDPTLKKHGITLDFGRVKNKNSNAVIDKGIQELEHEIVNVDPSGGPLSDVQLQLIMETLNSRIRNRGLSAREILYQRDQLTSNQLSINDAQLAHQQASLREHNHKPSAVSKSRGKPPAAQLELKVGNLVFIKDEGSKHKARERYIIVKIDGLYAEIQKLDDKFMSRQYKVPITNLFPASAIESSPKLCHEWDCKDTTSDDSNDEYDITFSDDETLSENGSNQSDEMENAENHDVTPPVTQQRAPSTRRRQPPAWIRSDDYAL